MSAQRGSAGGCRAWLAAALLVLAPLEATASSRTVRSTPLRLGPSWSSSTIDAVANDTSVQLLERQDKWALVRVEGREGWVRLDHVETIERAAPPALPAQEPASVEKPPKWADVEEPPRWADVEERSPWWDVERAQPAAVEAPVARSPRPPAPSSAHAVMAVQRADLRIVTPVSSLVASRVEPDPDRATPARPLLLRVAPSWAAVPAGTVPSGGTVSG